MAKRYELSDASWELTRDLVSPEQNLRRPRGDDPLALRGILWILCSGVAGVTCRNALGLGQRCISVFVAGATTACSTEYWSICIFE